MRQCVTCEVNLCRWVKPYNVFCGLEKTQTGQVKEEGSAEANFCEVSVEPGREGLPEVGGRYWPIRSWFPQDGLRQWPPGEEGLCPFSGPPSCSCGSNSGCCPWGQRWPAATQVSPDPPAQEQTDGLWASLGEDTEEAHPRGTPYLQI